MNPQLLQMLMSNPQMLQQLLGSGSGVNGQSSFQPIAAAAPPPAADYYGPAAGRAQYFANMGMDPNGQALGQAAVTPTPTVPTPGQRPPQRPGMGMGGGMGFASPFGQSMMRGGGQTGAMGGGQMFGRRGGMTQQPQQPSAGMAGAAGMYGGGAGSNFTSDPASQFTSAPSPFDAPYRRR